MFTWAPRLTTRNHSQRPLRAHPRVIHRWTVRHPADLPPGLLVPRCLQNLKERRQNWSGLLLLVAVLGLGLLLLLDYGPSVRRSKSRLGSHTLVTPPIARGRLTSRALQRSARDLAFVRPDQHICWRAGEFLIQSRENGEPRHGDLGSVGSGPSPSAHRC